MGIRGGRLLGLGVLFSLRIDTWNRCSPRDDPAMLRIYEQQ